MDRSSMSENLPLGWIHQLSIGGYQSQKRSPLAGMAREK